MTACEFQIIEGGKGLFLVNNRCYKNQNLPSTSCHAKKIQTIEKVYFVKKIVKHNIFHMPPAKSVTVKGYFWAI